MSKYQTNYETINIFKDDELINNVSIKIDDHNVLIYHEKEIMYEKIAISPVIVINHKFDYIGMIGGKNVDYRVSSVYMIDIIINIELNKVSEIELYLR